jgi:hypothetical protein
MMEYLTQGEYILVRLSPTHLLALSEGKNVKVKILGQRLTSYWSTKIMNEKTDHIHYPNLTGTLENDMWITDSGYSWHMTRDQDRVSNLN